MAINIETQETRIDPRVKRTQKLIREALRALLSEQSFESTSVQDISERATVNRATFYAHFTDKFALLDAIIREDIAARLSEGDPLAAPDVRTMLRTVTKNMFDFVASIAGAGSTAISSCSSSVPMNPRSRPSWNYGSARAKRASSVRQLLAPQ
jgi:AcrR family transcriptional regulator